MKVTNKNVYGDTELLKNAREREKKNVIVQPLNESRWKKKIAA